MLPSLLEDGGHTEEFHYETRDDQRIQLAQRSLQVLYNMCTHWMEKSTFLRCYILVLEARVFV